MDGYVTSIYTVAVGSVDEDGVQAPFDEDCPGKLAVAVNHNSHGSNQVVRMGLITPGKLRIKALSALTHTAIAVWPIELYTQVLPIERAISVL